MYDFHTHTFLSDGVLSPIELIRRALTIGYKVMAITDHVGPGNLEFILNSLKKECEEENGNVNIFKCDINSENQVQKFLKNTE